MCANEGISNMSSFAYNNLRDDLKFKFDNFIKNLMSGSMSPYMTNLINKKIFVTGYYAQNVNADITYLKYLQFYKTVFYGTLQYQVSSVSSLFYGVIVPNYYN